jgi:hypothetical protein
VCILRIERGKDAPSDAIDQAEHVNSGERLRGGTVAAGGMVVQAAKINDKVLDRSRFRH